MMNRRLLVLLTLLVCSTIHAAPPKNTAVPATVTFRCPTTAECASTDAFTADFGGAYANDVTKYYFDSLKDLRMYVASPRTVFLDFTRPDGPPPCASTSIGCRKNFNTLATTTPSPGTLFNPTDANDVELPNGFESIAVGATAYARLKIDFPDPSGRPYLWTVRFNSGAYAGSTNVTVTRTSATTWDIQATESDRARLVSTTTSGKQVMTDEGLYVFPFLIHVSK
jgi:hypothetical protein